MTAEILRAWAVWCVCTGALGLIAVQRQRLFIQFGRPELFTGWIVLTLLLFLGAFNIRKRLSMLPLGRASTWLRLHVAIGILALAVFWLHTGTVWPHGLYEQALALLFYALSLNGILGYFLQRIYPPRLTQTGLEIIYEQIPTELADLRRRAEVLVLACTKDTATDVLAQHYQQTLSWFFRQPRFFLSHVFGGLKGEYWVRYQCSTVERYLNPVERDHLTRLAALAQLKNLIDVHYAAQSVMKWWLLIHVPLAVATLALTAWHVVLVHIYAV